jgi:DNA polymerase-3 subunit gamma/tau
MENFIVSARKYRPITFKSVVGQENITSTLQNSIRNNHLAQAFLFCGPRGVGKTTCARILAKTINCMNLPENVEPCNECDSCKGFNTNASLNIHELDAASNNGVDEMRSLIDQVRFAPQIGKYSIYIIDEVHMLSAAAFNSFLKTLEEPPKHAIFILATTERHKILPTILSRCQVFTFNRIKVDDIANHLQYVAKSESIVAEPEALHVIAQKADGGLRDALSMFDQLVSYAGGEVLTYQNAIDNLNVLDYDYYFRMVDILLQSNYGAALLLFDEILSKGFDGSTFLSGLGEHYRNLLVCQDAVTLVLLEVSTGVKSRYQMQSQQCSPVLIIKSLEIVSKTVQGLREAKNQRLHIELGLLQLSMLLMQQEEKKKPEVSAGISSPATQTVIPQIPALEEKRTVMNYRGSATIKTVSINQHIQKKQSDEIETQVNSTEHSITEVLPNTPITEEKAQTVWLKYCEKLSNEGRKAMSGSLSITQPTLTDGFQLHFQVQNEAQLKEIELEKAALMMFLRKELNNYSVQLNLEKSILPIKTRPYTSEEKLAALEESNPNITLLKDKLGLILD